MSEQPVLADLVLLFDGYKGHSQSTGMHAATGLYARLFCFLSGLVVFLGRERRDFVTQDHHGTLSVMVVRTSTVYMEGYGSLPLWG